VAAGVAAVLLLVACTDSKSPGATSSSASDGPRHGGTLRIGIERPASLDPAAASPGSQSELLMADLLFDGLTSMAPGASEASPAIAESWSHSDDLKSWTFKLRADAHFSNGRRITADDVKYTLDRIKAMGETSVAASRLEPVASATAIDDSTLQVVTSAPLAVLPELLAAPEYGIVPKEAVEAATPAFAQAPAGSGPFAFSGQSGDVVTLVRAAGSPAYLDDVEVHEYDKADLGKARDEFAAGHLDWAVVPGGTAPGVAAPPSVPFDAELFYAFNLLDPTFADARFRQAIVKAVDRSAVVTAAYPGTAIPLGGPVPAGVAGHRDDPCGDPCSHDVGGAKALLAQAFPDGNIPTVNLDYFTGTGEEAVADGIASGLTAVGIPVNKRPLPPDQYDQFVVSGQAGLFRLGTIGVYASADAYLYPLFATGSHDNATGFSAPSVDQLLAAARSTADPAARLQLYLQAETAAMQQVPILPVAQFVTTTLASPRVHDLTLDLHGTFAAEKVWLE
jgi:ABC-type transport system substrate-binding protein